MSSEVQEQSASYSLADLKPVLEKSSSNNALLGSLPIWLSTQTAKSAGRGRSADNTHQYGVQKLRELILELAVRGKLVPQDANDEPASALLEKIAAEKARLFEEDKVKKQKSQPINKEIEILFPLPLNWNWINLGELVDVLDSQRKPITKTDRKDGPYPYYGASGIVDYVADFIFDEPLVLVGEDGAKWGRGDETAFSISGKTWVNNHAHVLRAKEYAVNQAYLVYYLTASDLSDYITGMTVPKLNQKRLISIPVSLPPLAEQHRIVKKVDELMALCDKLEQQQADAVHAHDTLVKVLLDTLTQSDNADDFQHNWRRIAEHFDTLFTTESSIDQLKQTLLQLAVMGKLVPQDPNDEPANILLDKITEEKAGLLKDGKINKSKKLPAVSDEEQIFTLPNGWAWTRLESLFNVIVDCPHSTPKFKDVGKLCLDTNSFKDGKLIKHKLRYVSDETFDARNSRLVPEHRDIVFAREGSVGESVVIPPDIDCCLGQRVMLFRPSPTLNPNFLRLTLSSEIALKTLLSLHKGIGAKHVNVGDMRNYVVACPPSEEQHRIIKKVDELMGLCDQLKERINQAQTLQQQLADAVVETTVN